ncbi:MAG: hypothetical protein JO048_06605, partial [Methylobacteriaceae bacterium]|nr:hypothetical protein [Methylobacteriaceae bacterium]
MVEETTAASLSLVQEAETLAGLVGQFKVAGEDAGNGRAARPRSASPARMQLARSA